MQDIVVTPRVIIPGGELAIAFSRSGGPGGQNVNKVASKVELRWNPTTSAALTSDERAWLIERLRSRLTSRAALDRPKPRRATKLSRSAKRRRVADKRHHAEIKRNRSGSGD